MNQRELFLQRDEFFLPKSQSRSKEICKSDAHFARSLRIAIGKRADGVQAIEQKMRIDLSLKRAELRVARKHMGFHHTLLSLPRLFLSLKHVEQCNRKQIFENANDQQKLSDIENFRLNIAEAPGVRKRLGEAQRREHPEPTDNDGR